MLGSASNAERGHAVLYAVLLVPFAFLLTTIAVDISAWNATRDKLQQEADRLAFQGLGGLPDTAEVRTRVLQAAQGLIASGVEATVFFPDAASRSSVGVTLSSQYQPRFGLFSAIGSSDTFKIRRSGVAQLVPGDFVLIVADGSTLRPPLLPLANAAPGNFAFPAWGSAADWPASPYFQRVSPLNINEPNPLEWNWAKDWTNPDFQRWATQSCFNPVFTPLKFAAAGISEALMGYGVNRIGFMFTPGEQSNQGFRVLRHVHGQDDDAETYAGQIGGFPNVERILAGWGNYTEFTEFLGDGACVIFSDPLLSISSRYSFPTGTQPCSGDALLANTAENLSGYHHLSDNFSDCYANLGLSLRDAIYWDAAKLSLPGFSARPNIIASLRQAWTELTDDRTLALEHQKRGNLASNSLRQVLVLTDSLPDPDDADLQSLLDAFESRNIQVTVAAFVHEGLSAADAQELKNAAGGWKTLARDHPKVLRAILADDALSLQTQVVPQFLSSALHFALRT